MFSVLHLNRFRLISLLLVSFIVVMMQPASATEYRKCNLKMMVKGVGLPISEVEGARFWAWARADNASSAWNLVNLQASLCASALSWQDNNTLPNNCASNKTALDDGRKGSGITGITMLHVRSQIKKTICENHVRQKSRVRTIFDTREIDGFYLWIEPVGNSRACLADDTYRPFVLTIHCRRSGRDSTYEWFYQKE